MTSSPVKPPDATAAAPPAPAAARPRTTLLLAVLLPLSLAAGWLMAGAVAREVPPLAAAFGRTAASVPVLALVLAAKRSYRAGGRVALRRPRAVTGLAVTGFLVYYVGTFASIEVAGPALTGLVVSLLPCLTFVIGLAAFGERASVRRAAGTAVATAAVIAYTLSQPGAEGFGGATAAAVTGFGIALVATASYALYTHLFKRTMADLPSPASLPAITLVGALLLAPAGLWQARAAGLTAADWGLVALLGAVFTAPVFLMAHELVLRRGPLFTNSVALVVPFLIRLGSWWLGWQPAPGPVEVVWFAVCAAGVRLAIAVPRAVRSAP